MTRSGALGPTPPSGRGRPVPCVTIPSDDLAFREHVKRLSERFPADSAADLEARLRRLFPRVVVHPRALFAEPDAWYVYRDGAWRPPVRPWWTDSLVPHLVFGADGWTTAANAGASSLLGFEPDEPRHYSDFVMGGAGDAADALFEIVTDGNPLAATLVLRQAGGDAIACEVRAEPLADEIHVWLRLAEDLDPVAVEHDRMAPTMHTEPAADALFRAYVDRQLQAMLDPTPEGLGLRLRRLYPHAHVEVTGPMRWTARRDSDGQASDGPPWWREGHLARVRYDDRGLILAANEAAEQLLGRQLTGHHWQELVTPGSTEEVEPMLAMIRTAGEAVSRFRMPGAGGGLIEFDSHTRMDRGEFVTTMRPRQP